MPVFLTGSCADPSFFAACHTARAWWRDSASGRAAGGLGLWGDEAGGWFDGGDGDCGRVPLRGGAVCDRRAAPAAFAVLLRRLPALRGGAGGGLGGGGRGFAQGQRRGRGLSLLRRRGALVLPEMRCRIVLPEPKAVSGERGRADGHVRRPRDFAPYRGDPDGGSAVMDGRDWGFAEALAVAVGGCCLLTQLEIASLQLDILADFSAVDLALDESNIR